MSEDSGGIPTGLLVVTANDIYTYVYRPPRIGTWRYPGPWRRPKQLNSPSTNLAFADSDGGGCLSTELSIIEEDAQAVFSPEEYVPPDRATTVRALLETGDYSTDAPSSPLISNASEPQLSKSVI